MAGGLGWDPLGTTVGTATISDSDTSVDVAHGQSSTPSLSDFQVTATNDLGSASKFWISAVDATNFTITVDAAPGSGNTAEFVWLFTGGSAAVGGGGGGGGSNPTFVQAKAVQGTSTAMSVTLAATPTEDNLLLCMVTSAGTTSTSDITDIFGWTLVDSGASSGLGAENMIFKLFSKTAGPSESSVVAASISNSNAHTIAVCEVSDATTVDVNASATISGSTALGISATTGSATTQADELAVSFMATPANPGSVSVGDSFTSQNATVRAVVATKVLSTTGTVTSSYSWTNSVGGAMAVVSVK